MHKMKMGWNILYVFSTLYVITFLPASSQFLFAAAGFHSGTLLSRLIQI